MLVYLNGNYLPESEARIPVLDRGFIFGDGVYEVVPVYSAKPFRLAAHLARLQHSLDGIRLANPHDEAGWAGIVRHLIAAHGEPDLYIYLHVTRGVAMRDHPFPNPPVPPTVFAFAAPLPAPPAALATAGVACITATDNRWLRCDIKAISLLPNVLLRQQSVDAGCNETLLLRDDAWLTEGSASNVFLVRDGVLLAPPKSHLMLPGITYDVMLELAAGDAIPYQVRPIAKTELFAADEVMITSSTKEVLAVTRIDGRSIGTGVPGPLFKRLHALYQNFKHEVMRK